MLRPIHGLFDRGIEPLVRRVTGGMGSDESLGSEEVLRLAREALEDARDKMLARRAARAAHHLRRAGSPGAGRRRREFIPHEGAGPGPGSTTTVGGFTSGARAFGVGARPASRPGQNSGSTISSTSWAAGVKSCNRASPAESAHVSS